MNAKHTPLLPDDLVQMRCPDCPDGQIWDKRGPTGETCPTCSGAALVWVTLDEAREEREEL